MGDDDIVGRKGTPNLQNQDKGVKVPVRTQRCALVYVGELILNNYI